MLSHRDTSCDVDACEARCARNANPGWTTIVSQWHIHAMIAITSRTVLCKMICDVGKSGSLLLRCSLSNVAMFTV